MKDGLKDFEIELITTYDIEFEIDMNENGNIYKKSVDYNFERMREL